MIRFVVAAVWAVTLAVAFTVGRIQPVAVEGVVVEAGVEAMEYEPSLPVRNESIVVGTEAFKVAPAAAPISVVGASSGRRAASVSVVELSFGQKMERAFGELHPVKRAMQFDEILAGLTADNAAILYERLKEEPYSEERQREMKLLAFAWGELDGAAAIAAMQGGRGGNWGRGGRDGGSLTGSVLTGWASSDPDAAEAWAKKQDERRQDYYMAGVIKGTALVDPDLAAKQIYSLPYGDARGRAAQGLIEVYMKDGVESTMNRIASLPADKLKDGIVRIATGQIAGKDPAVAAEWLQSLDDTDISSSVGMVGAHWSRTDPDSALAWAQSLETEAQRDSGVASVVRHWPSDRIEDLETWATGLTDVKARDAAARSLAIRNASMGNETATHWLDSIEDPKLREDTTRVLERYAKGGRRR